MKVTSEALGGVGATQTQCDFCGKRTPLVWRSNDGEFCSNDCLEKAQNGETMVTEATATETAAEVKTNTAKKNNKKVAAKGVAKGAAKGKEKGAAKAASSRSTLNPESKVTVKNKDAEFRGKRGKAFKALKTGMTVEQACVAIDKVFAYGAGGTVLRAMVTAGAISIK